MNKMSYKVAILSLFIAFTLILSYIEFLIPISYGFGLKLGLANAAIVAILYVFSLKEALLVNIVRILISGFLFGNMMSIAFSLSGGVSSCIIMALFKKIKGVNIITVSILGAVSHNIGQLLAAYVITRVPGLVFYLPTLMIGGIITGILIGILSKIVIKVLKEMDKYDSVFKR